VGLGPTGELVTAAGGGEMHPLNREIKPIPRINKNAFISTTCPRKIKIALISD
jgi:hypothetical protein